MLRETWQRQRGIANGRSSNEMWEFYDFAFSCRDEIFNCTRLAVFAANLVCDQQGNRGNSPYACPHCRGGLGKKRVFRRSLCSCTVECGVLKSVLLHEFTRCAAVGSTRRRKAMSKNLTSRFSRVFSAEPWGKRVEKSSKQSRQQQYNNRNRRISLRADPCTRRFSEGSFMRTRDSFHDSVRRPVRLGSNLDPQVGSQFTGNKLVASEDSPLGGVSSYSTIESCNCCK